MPELISFFVGVPFVLVVIVALWHSPKIYKRERKDQEELIKSMTQ